MAAVANLCDKWAQHGFIILPVVDGTRPVTKQATNEHRAAREESRILAVSTRQKLRKVKELLLQDEFNSDTRKELEDYRKSMETEIKTAETRSLNIVGTG